MSHIRGRRTENESGVDEFLLDRREYERWSQTERNESLETTESETAAVLEALFRFLADGLTLGNFSQRALALLLVVRPDLVGHRGANSLGRELRVRPDTVTKAVAEMRAEFPALVFDYRRTRKGVRRRVLHREAVRRSLELQELRALNVEMERIREVRKREELCAFFRQLDRELGVDRAALGLEP